MNKQNKAQKYKKRGMGLEVKLHGTSYSVMALTLKDTSNETKFYVSLMLKRDDIPRYDVMSGDLYEISCDETDNVNYAVYKFISKKHKNGDFQHYIDMYEYEVKMTDKGIEVDENERIGKNGKRID